MRFFIDVINGLRIAFGALRANKLRAGLTALGIVIGVMTVIMMVVIVLGLNKALRSQLDFLGAETVFVSRWDWMSNNWRDMIKRRDMRVDYIEALREESEYVEAISPFYDREMTVTYRGSSLSRVNVQGVSEEFFITNPKELAEGRIFTEQEVSRNAHVAVIGQDVARSLFPEESPIGKTIKLNGWDFEVIGMSTPFGKVFGQSWDNFAVVPYGAFQKRFSGRWADLTIVAKSVEGGHLDDMKWEVEGIMRRLRKLDPRQANDFGLNTQSAILEQFDQMTAAVYAGGIIIGFISLLVGGIGIMNIMLVSVTERTAEIGLRKALGAKNWNISWQFLVESAVICAIGGIFGVAMAAGLSKAINNFLPTYMPMWIVGVGVIFSGVVGIIFGLYPAMKAARLSPIEALRSD
ncbi:ABC transporter permease [bacterium]|jgi:putative ABC transport system permease protein|nr:ABC transporter permease [bacterium]